MRFLLLIVVVVFTGLIGIATLLDIIHRKRVSGLDVASILIVVIFATGIVGALTQRPRQ
ncbi:MAG TPA: hypothetical protein VGH67_22375 [Solirubrobacteraceae bacterium]